MGAWNTGIYDNDLSLDFLQKIKDCMFNMAEYNEEYLVIADICLEYLAIIEPEERRLINKVIQEELNNLSEWQNYEDIEKRKTILSELEIKFNLSNNLGNSKAKEE